MKRILKLGGFTLLAGLLFTANDGQAQAPRLVVEEGPLTPECPFGICPVTEKARTASDFYQLFGYLPASSGVKYPGVGTMPPKSWTKTYWTPKPHQVELMKLDPLAPYKPPGSAQPPKNAPLAQSVKQLTAADKDKIKSRLGVRHTKLLDDLRRLVAKATDPQRRAELEKTLERVAGLVSKGGVSKRDLADLVAGIKSALPPADQGPALDAAGQIAAIEQVKQWIDGNGGTKPAATAGNNTAGNNTARPTAPNNAAAGVAGVGAANPGRPPRWADLTNAAGGPGPQANGGGGVNVPIGMMPDLPAGVIVPLPFNQGGGAALVGMGQPDAPILLGAGDPDRAAGFPVAPPDAPPAPDGAGPSSTSGTVLSNAAAAPIRYSVNQSPFTMQPQDKQTLPAGTTWIVEFDRGNGRGSARYQLEQGHYEFRSTDNGWDLYRKQFTSTLENVGGLTPFTYVVGDRTQTLDVGQKHDLTGSNVPVLRFEDGAGQVKQRRLTSGDFRVALGMDRTLDVYSAESIPVTIPAAAPAPRAPNSGAPSPVSPQALSPPARPARSGPTATSGLPPGFQPFDTTAAMTDGSNAVRIPQGFGFF